MYLAYARHDRAVSESQVVDSARILLEHGADPNVGYLWHGLPSPFTALTGTFGEGELGPTLQPRHPHSLALARLLLEAGAEANDSQALYNRMFGDDDDHLVLLFEFGLGTGDGGPWRARLGDAIDSPEALLRAQLRWAVMHDQRARVRLLLEHGVDPDTTFPDGRSAIEAAEMSGHREISELLAERGAADARLDPVAAFIAAVFAHDPAAACVRSRGRRPGERGAARADRLGCGAGQPRRGGDVGRARLRRGCEGPRRRTDRAGVGDRAARRGGERRQRSRRSAARLGARTRRSETPASTRRPRVGARTAATPS